MDVTLNRARGLQDDDRARNQQLARQAEAFERMAEAFERVAEAFERMAVPPTLVIPEEQAETAGSSTVPMPLMREKSALPEDLPAD